MVYIQKKHCNIEEWDKLEFDTSVPYEFVVHNNGVPFEFLYKPKALAKNILIFNQSALGNRNIDLPIYHRASWADDYQESICIFLNDPTLYLGSDYLGGWYQGTRDHYYLKDYIYILRSLIDKLKFSYEKVYFYGSSAGGFASLMMAAEIEGSSAIAEVSQINMLDYHVISAFNNIMKYSYGGLDKNEIMRLYSNRLNVIAKYNEVNIPNILFIQNIADVIHNKCHLFPFIDFLNKKYRENSESLNTLDIKWYFQVTENGDGHVPASRSFIKKTINSYLLKSN